MCAKMKKDEEESDRADPTRSEDVAFSRFPHIIELSTGKRQAGRQAGRPGVVVLGVALRDVGTHPSTAQHGPARHGRQCLLFME